MPEIDWERIKESISDALDHIGPMLTTDDDFEMVQPIVRTMDNQQVLSELIQRSLQQIKEPKLASMSMLVSILFLVEGPIAFWVNQFIYYLIKNRHHDLWSEVKREYVKRYDDISMIPLSTKIAFLKEHSFDLISQLRQNFMNIETNKFFPCQLFFVEVLQ